MPHRYDSDLFKVLHRKISLVHTIVIIIWNNMLEHSKNVSTSSPSYHLTYHIHTIWQHLVYKTRRHLYRTGIRLRLKLLKCLFLWLSLIYEHFLKSILLHFMSPLECAYLLQQTSKKTKNVCVIGRSSHVQDVCCYVIDPGSPRQWKLGLVFLSLAHQGPPLR
jgi:hypothetical protein